uniref:Carboxylesterase n=1 Tax=Pieris rapae TaxID=64459 RepID=A0A1U9X1W4_PIERA|nr:carboxylesterase [Pieris rapae]
MKMHYLKKPWSIMFLFMTFAKCGANNDVKLNIKQGTLSGLRKQTFFNDKIYYSFTGIPFANPPLGALRLQPPQSHEGWEGILKAHEEKPTCFQVSFRIRNNEPPGFSGSEDCLYLNVYSPDIESSAPVVVFDYNDNFKTGFNGSQTYSPDFFIEEGVIVVNINHRLGIFGYLTTEDDVIPPNAGLQDFILGLKWIQDNIKAFGGDPKRVTIMGNRGGAVIANILLHSDKAKDLFSSVILQSGTAMESIYFDNNPKEKAFKIGELLNITTDDSKILLEKLQLVDANTLLSLEGNVFDDRVMNDLQLSIDTFSPTIDKNTKNAVIATLPENANIVNDVPVLVGFNSREGLDLVSPYLMEPRMVNDIKNTLFIFPIRVDFHFDRNSSIFHNALSEALHFYLKDGYLHYTNILDYAVYVGDLFQNYALHTTAKKLSRDLKSEVYYYLFDYRGALNENSEYISRFLRFSMEHWGATITDELCYLLLCTRIKKTYNQYKKLPSEQPEFKVLKKMVRMWTNFAKYGNPTPIGNDDILKDTTWLPMDKKGDSNYLHISKTLKMKKNPLGKRSEFWDAFLNKYREMTKDGTAVNEEIHHFEL